MAAKGFKELVAELKANRAPAIKRPKAPVGHADAVKYGTKKRGTKRARSKGAR